ncbi:unnamed protein product [Schistosoma rodhaini]|uniref:Reverse transcriptase domain-containing protein n=1 Tax=Schistosoma mansoni TaxID=6183 RepID=A0A5K4F7M5_SCHMA|nr:unnamed protein product [Schistosoma rodhaini]
MKFSLSSFCNRCEFNDMPNTIRETRKLSSDLLPNPERTTTVQTTANTPEEDDEVLSNEDAHDLHYHNSPINVNMNANPVLQEEEDVILIILEELKTPMEMLSPTDYAI